MSVLEGVAVGTVCGFEAAAAPSLYEHCSDSNCHCLEHSNLEYTEPFFCNVSGRVLFSVYTCVSLCVYTCVCEFHCVYIIIIVQI